jgi:carbonic anhydrase/acetyltransferase-like protein (isoleucine patch superfamily)
VPDAEASLWSAPGPLLLAYRGVAPRIHGDAWVAPGATVIGDVEIGAESSVWFGAVVRGDFHWIRVGARTNLQDGCVVHVTRERFPAWIGDEVTVGHGATVHGCRVGHGALVGIGAIVLDGAEIGEEGLVAAGAVVTPGSAVPPRTLVAGAPARPVRALAATEVADQRARALGYVRDAREYARALRG